MFWLVGRTTQLARRPLDGSARRGDQQVASAVVVFQLFLAFSYGTQAKKKQTQDLENECVSVWVCVCELGGCQRSQSSASINNFFDGGRQEKRMSFPPFPN